jgi:hypothetical protein
MDRFTVTGFTQLDTGSSGAVETIDLGAAFDWGFIHRVEAVCSSDDWDAVIGRASSVDFEGAAGFEKALVNVVAIATGTSVMPDPVPVFGGGDLYAKFKNDSASTTGTTGPITLDIYVDRARS